MKFDDTDRLEALCNEIAKSPPSKRTDRALWDLVERLAAEVMVLRLQRETEHRQID